MIGIILLGALMPAHPAEAEQAMSTPPASERSVKVADAHPSSVVQKRIATWRETVAAGVQAKAAALRDAGFAENLKNRAELDVEVRGALSAAVAGLASEDRISVIKAVQPELQRIDQDNSDYLKSMLPRNGWVPREAGRLVSTHAWLIVQHSPELAFQQQVLKTIEPLVGEGEISAPEYALLFDRVQMRAGKPQRYGTQVLCKDGHFSIVPVEDAANLDERRAAMGLDRAADYHARMKSRC